MRFLKIIALGCAVGLPVLGAVPGLAADDLHLIPRPASVATAGCGAPFSFARPMRAAAGFDSAARAELDERWRGLGLPAIATSASPDIVVKRDASLGPQAYRLNISGPNVRIAAGGADGAFYAAMTLAQLPQRPTRAATLRK